MSIQPTLLQDTLAAKCEYTVAYNPPYYKICTLAAQYKYKTHFATLFSTVEYIVNKSYKTLWYFSLLSNV